MKQDLKGLFKFVFGDKNIWILFIICSSFYLKVAANDFILSEFIFREVLIYFFCGFLMINFHRRYLRKIDEGEKISPAVVMFKYLVFGLGFFIFILAVAALDEGVNAFFREFRSLVMMMIFYFQLDNMGSIFIGNNYIYFDYEVVSINELTGYEFKGEEKVNFYKTDESKVSFKIPNLSLKKKIRNELNNSRLPKVSKGK
jgi:hypothetical protein